MQKLSSFLCRRIKSRLCSWKPARRVSMLLAQLTLTRIPRAFARLRRWCVSSWLTPVLLEMARIVQAADIKGQLDDHPAACGLQLMSRGFPLVTNNDHETAERAAFVYDALYASIKQDQAPRVTTTIETKRKAGMK